MGKAKIVMLLSLLLALSSQHAAAALRCGTGLVSRGDHQAEVLLLCGEPEYSTAQEIYHSGVVFKNRDSSKKTTSEVVTGTGIFPNYRGSVVLVPKEVWVYNFGSRQFMQEVTFVNGEVTKIRSLGFGH